MPEAQRQLVTVMAGYVRGGIWSAVTLRWIQALRSISDSLVLVFDQDDLSPPDELADDDEVCFLARRHRAYDFGSYRLGLAEAESRGWLSSATHVLLCNDSVIGPLFDLEPLLLQMIQSPAPVWGLTESYLYSPHLQSYFLLMQADVAREPSVRTFFDAVVPQPSRHEVIQAYELGFSRLIKGLGLSWKAWLPASEQFDPCNGELMANVTAYPLFCLREGLPVMKTRALKETEANMEGFAPTCTVLAEEHPQIWQELRRSSSCSRMWQESISVGILLRQSDLSVLDQRVAWIKAHPHPNLKALVAVPMNQVALRAQLHREFKSELQDGTLSLLITGLGQSATQILLQLLALESASDWVLISSASLWSDFSGLQVQLRRLASDPTMRIVHGNPVLRRRVDCFAAKDLQSLLEEWGDG